MKSLHRIILFCIVLTNAIGCGKNDSDNQNRDLGLLVLVNASNQSTYKWNLPAGFPTPRVPADNPMTEAKVELGRFLFYDRKLSGNETMSCSSCHLQELAFSDGKALPSGITGEVHPRNSQHLPNVAYLPRITWNNPILKSLEQQALVPLFGETPVELGLTNDQYLVKIKADNRYKTLFNDAFPGNSDPVNEKNIRFALSSFQRSMISGNSPFDKAVYQKDNSALNASALRGLAFFNGETAECFHCHGGFNFTDTVLHNATVFEEVFYHNNGTRTKAFLDAQPKEKQGLKEITGLESDQGKFKSPSLRNISVTFPYMHDGSIMCDAIADPNQAAGQAAGATRDTCARNALGKVIDQYARGGNGHPNVDTTLIRPFSLQTQEKEDLINFLMALKDDEFLNNPKFSNPFRR